MLNAKERIEVNASSFTESDRIIAEAILSYPGLVERFTVQQLADHLSLSTASIMRFAKKLGYTGYSEFRFEFMRSLHNADTPADTGISTPLGKYTQWMIHSLEQMAEMDEQTFVDVAEKLHTVRTVYAVGNGKTGLVCRYMQYSFLRCSRDIIPITDSVLIHDLPKVKDAHPLYLYFSEKASQISDLLPGFINETCKEDIILITCNPNTPLAKKAGQTIVVPNVDTSQEGIRSHALFLNFIDILLAYYLEKK